MLKIQLSVTNYIKQKKKKNSKNLKMFGIKYYFCHINLYSNTDSYLIHNCFIPV